jgi:hypothetical protein
MLAHTSVATGRLFAAARLAGLALAAGGLIFASSAHALEPMRSTGPSSARTG